MLRISKEQHERLVTELSYSPYAYIPSHKIVDAKAKDCLTDHELLLIILILQHRKFYTASDDCLKKSFAKHGIDEITYKRTKWSLMFNRKLIDCTPGHSFFYIPTEYEKNHIAIDIEMDDSFAVFDETVSSSTTLAVVASKAKNSALQKPKIERQPRLNPAIKIKQEETITEPTLVNFTPGFFARGSFCYYATPTRFQNILPTDALIAMEPTLFPLVEIKPDPLNDIQEDEAVNALVKLRN